MGVVSKGVKKSTNGYTVICPSTRDRSERSLKIRGFEQDKRGNVNSGRLYNT